MKVNIRLTRKQASEMHPSFIFSSSCQRSFKFVNVFSQLTTLAVSLETYICLIHCPTSNNLANGIYHKNVVFHFAVLLQISCFQNPAFFHKPQRRFSSTVDFLGPRGPLRTPSFVRPSARPPVPRQKSKSPPKPYKSSQDHARPLI